MSGAEFPLTHVSAVLALRSEDPLERKRSLERVLEGYYKPVYKHLRLKWRRSSEDAEDLAQAFFLRATEKRVFAAYEPSRGRFRTFVRACLDHFVLQAHASEMRVMPEAVYRKLTRCFTLPPVVIGVFTDGESGMRRLVCFCIECTFTE